MNRQATISTVICVLWVALLASFSAQAQNSFQNLDFESANVPASPAEFYPNFVSVGSALPGWRAYLGADRQTQVGYNAPANSTASITLMGPTWSTTYTGRYYGVGIIGGNYSVDLQTGASPSNLGDINASIEQTGSVPSDVKSLQFNALETTPLTVSFNGNSLMPVALSSGVSADGVPYTSYGADISAWAGQTGELEFTADFNGSFNFVVVDDISFSTTAVPEPSIVVLIAIGGLVFGARRWFGWR